MQFYSKNGHFAFGAPHLWGLRGNIYAADADSFSHKETLLQTFYEINSLLHEKRSLFSPSWKGVKSTVRCSH